MLRQLGEAAAVDRVNLMLAQPGPAGERLLVVAAEWVAEGVAPHLGHPTMGTHDERNFERECVELRAGRSVCIIKEGTHEESCGCVLEGVGTKTKAIVPIFVDGEYVGAVGFDSTRQRRAIDSAELSGAGDAGGHHRRGASSRAPRRHHAPRARARGRRTRCRARKGQRFHPRQPRAARQRRRICKSFMGHLLLEATRQLEAAGGSVILLKDAEEAWRMIAYVKNGEIAEPNFPASVPCSEAKFDARLRATREADLPRLRCARRTRNASGRARISSKREERLMRMFVLPLVFGDRTMGCIALSFRHREPISPQATELLVALAQQATLAIELTRLAQAGKAAAVLVERNRIGQEIHDGLAQAFTGILMQLGAAEELQRLCEGQPAAAISTRAFARSPKMGSPTRAARFWRCGPRRLAAGSLS